MPSVGLNSCLQQLFARIGGQVGGQHPGRRIGQRRAKAIDLLVDQGRVEHDACWLHSSSRLEVERGLWLKQVAPVARGQPGCHLPLGTVGHIPPRVLRCIWYCQQCTAQNRRSTSRRLDLKLRRERYLFALAEYAFQEPKEIPVTARLLQIREQRRRNP